LNLNGHTACAVGGCVRDSLLGKEPDDWDICTSALPERVKEIFAAFNVVETGLKHGTVTVIIDKKHYEVTTFRLDGEYKDNRRPESVSFTEDIKSDLSRRDFTVNAMAYSLETGLIDCFGGREDLQRGIIRTVGDADARFGEDALRILRALRFASALGFEIEPETARGAHENRMLLKNIAAERLNIELCKLLTGKAAEKILLEFYDVFCVFIEEFERARDWELMARAFSPAENEKLIRLALFFGCLTANEAREAMSRLRFDKKTLEAVCTLIKHSGAAIAPSAEGVRGIASLLGGGMARRLISLQQARALARGDIDRLNGLKTASALLEKILSAGDCLTLKDLAVNGDDLLALGIRGKEVGRVLDALLEAVIADPGRNEKNILLEMAGNL